MEDISHKRLLSYCVQLQSEAERNKLLEVEGGGGHLPQCPRAGDANAHQCCYRCVCLPGLPWGRDFYPHPTHPIPTPTGIPIRYPRQTWCLLVLQRCRATTTTTSRRRTAATSDDRTDHTCRGAVAGAPPSQPPYQRPPWPSSPPSHRRFLHATTAVFDLPTRFEWSVLGCRTPRQ